MRISDLKKLCMLEKLSVCACLCVCAHIKLTFKSNVYFSLQLQSIYRKL